MDPGQPYRDGGSGGRVNQSVVGGIALIALAIFALYALRNLAYGSLGSMGPGLLPRVLAVMVGFCGLLLLAVGVLRSGERLGGIDLRAAILVPGAIAAFALTIRPMDLGFVTTPGLGLVVAGPLAILLGGFATPQARLGELLVMALLLTAFCMLLFGDLLSLTIPLFPQSLTGWFPAGWSQRAVLRATAAILAAAGLLVLAVVLVFGRRGGARG